MKKLNKDQIQQRNALHGKLVRTRREIEDAVDAFNEGVRKLHAELEAVFEAHNDALRESAEWRDEIVTLAQDYQGERSEKWADSDPGQAHNDWIEAFENVTLDEVLVPDCPEMDVSDIEVDYDDFAGLPDSPGDI